MVQRCSNGVGFVVLEPEPSFRTGISIEIYRGANPTNLIDVLPDSFDRKWTDPIEGTGAGEFKVYADNPKLAANPDLLQAGNIVRLLLDRVPRFAFKIEKRKLVQIKSEGDSARAWHISGRGVLSLLEDAQIYPAGGLLGTVERSFAGVTPGSVLSTLIGEATARANSILTQINLGFTATEDSNHIPYDNLLELNERAGTDLLRVADRISELAADVWMSPTLTLNLYNTRGIDRTIQTINVGPLVLQPGHNVLELERDEEAVIRNALLIETPGGFVERVEGASVTEYRRREGFLSLGNIIDSSQIDRAAEAVFERSANPAEAISINITDADGRRPYVDFGPGDWVLAPSRDDVLERYRVAALTITEESDGQITAVPELNTLTEELEARLARWMQSMARGTMGGTASDVTEPNRAPAEVQEAIDSEIGEHEVTFAHPDELSDLADVELTGLTNRDLLTYDAGAGEWVPLAVRIDIDTTPPTDGQVLKYHQASGLWLPKPDNTGGGGGGGGSGKAQAYSPVGVGGDDFADGLIHADWVAVNRGGVAGINWSEAYNQLRFLKSDATGWGTRDIAAQMRPVSIGVGDYLEAAVRFRMRLSFWGWCIILADGNTWGAGTQLVLWGHQPSTVVATHRIEIANYTNYSTIGTRHGTLDVVPVEDSLYVRLEKSGAAEFKAYYSFLGDDWVLADTTVGGPSFTVTHVGLGILNFDNPAAPQAVAFDYFDTSV